MVDAHTVDAAGGGHAGQQAVGVIEHRRVFLAQGNQVVDVEEAPVVDFLGGVFPPAQAEALLGQEPVQGVKAFQIAGLTVQAFQAGADVMTDGGTVHVEIP